MICPDCHGNGYIGSSVEPENQKDCELCQNQGEVEINEKNLKHLRESGL
jgi:DnaJ-class molecular chaperone